ncbi:hypothetical protein L083_1132 [Actinoplanes sp. N902-109]|nr:hypothetical protein L083_1132 [Actinoplanes sp. N902-109]
MAAVGATGDAEDGIEHRVVRAGDPSGAGDNARKTMPTGPAEPL